MTDQYGRERTDAVRRRLIIAQLVVGMIVVVVLAAVGFAAVAGIGVFARQAPP